jgi:tetratricopeptide (TPR) repeat protein
MQEELARIEADKEKIAKEKEKLMVDRMFYAERNTDLQKDKEDLEKKFKEAKKIIGNKEADMLSITKKLEDLEQKTTKGNINQQKIFLKERKELKEKARSLEATLQKERALYHYNLGVSYTQLKRYDEATEAYEKSLELDVNNADAHYNLGLLYKDVKQDPDKAIMHLSKYLELKPDAEDKEEVQGWIEKLK